MATVFISSTTFDLEDFRLSAAIAAHAADIHADMQENWTAKDHPPLDACLKRVREADVLIVILAYRYGWVPEDVNFNPDGKSITWLECEEAVASDKQVLAFVVAEGADWPEELKDEADLKRAAALADVMEATNLFEETYNRIRRLKEFKKWLSSRGLRRTFRTKEELKLEVERALNKWRLQQAQSGATQDSRVAHPVSIPPAYLQWVSRECESVEFLGLEAQERQPNCLSQVYVPAITPAKRQGDDLADMREQPTQDDRLQYDLLLDRLAEESLYVSGDPGAGKSTFCRWLALVAASDALPSHPIPDPADYCEIYPEQLRDRLPVLVPLREFWQSLPLARGAEYLGASVFLDSLDRWLVDRADTWRLSAGTLPALLDAGRVLLILDGVDEVPVTDGAETRMTYPRACLLAALSDGRDAWAKAGNRLLVASRPYGLHQENIQRMGLPETRLVGLVEGLQDLFIRRWYAAADPDAAKEKADGLIDDLTSRPDLAELKRNPMLLTAFCVRYGDGQRLPQDLHDLYDKIVNNVLFNRYRGEGHERVAVRRRLAAIALGMHIGSDEKFERATPEAAVSLDEVESILANYAQLNPSTEAGSIAAAQRRDELLSRSGLLLGRGPNKASFYHLSFQEFLAAEHLALTRRASDWFETVVDERAQVPEWRLTLVFLFGRMLERNGEQWALEEAQRLLESQNREAVRLNPASAGLCSDWLEILQRRRLNLGELKDRFTDMALEAIEDQIPLDYRFRLGVVLGLVGDPRLSDPRDPEWQQRGLVEVVAGRYADQDGYQEIRQPFLIGRYPVTNCQYDFFIQDGGYRDRSLWSPEGWTWRAREEVTEPRFWHDSRFNIPNQPVVGVSYWEAKAFCEWVHGRLPTEQEWEAAARGAEGYEYPWGRSWEEGVCNTQEVGLGRSSPVGLFPRSRQKELKIEDMAGNIWEWCSRRSGGRSDSGRSVDSRVLRGGSWFSTHGVASANCREDFLPNNRGNYYGFRMCIERGHTRT